MDKIKKYQTAVLDFLNTYADEMYGQDPSGIETFVVSDKENHHYQIMRIGWNEYKHIFYCPIYIDIKNGKVWIQVNNTEDMIGDELIKRGIPKSDIVLAFHHEEMRPYSGFAVS